jgi:zinc-binding alcohol dehydrogenase/oxidoreductase
MRALVFERKGELPALRDVPTPDPGLGEVRVRLHAAALNRRDWWITRGLYPGIRTPCVLGSDGAGVVEALGAGVDAGLLGTDVVINPSLDWGAHASHQSADYTILGMPRDGTLAEAVVVPAANVRVKPAHLSFEEAAALPLAGLTAWRALFTRAALRAGERVLVTGVGGGVAAIALLLARAAGAEVFVTSGDAHKLAAATSAGALGGASYREAGWPARLRALAPGGFDVVVDSAGGSEMPDLVGLLAPGGRLVFFGGTRGPWPALHPAALFFRQVSLLGSTMGSPQEFDEMLAFVEAHRLTPWIDSTHGLAAGEVAFARLAKSVQLGKVVLRPAGPLS